MTASFPVVLEGVLKADDTIELASLPALPPGPVRVRLEAVAKVENATQNSHEIRPD
jgi:hypothetical protein